MKRVLVLVLILGIYVSINKMIVYGQENINLNLKNNEISITFIKDNILVTNKKNVYLSFNDDSESVERFGKTSLININNVDVDFEYNYEYKLNNELIIDEINYEIEEDIIRIKYNNSVFCIYNSQNINIKNTLSCNFLYLFNTKNINNIDVNENMDIIFFNEKASISTYFLEDIYSKWIDIYKLRDNEFVSLIISDDDYRIIVIPDE